MNILTITRRHLNHFYFFLIFCLILVRFANLTALPIFGDETLYLSLADQMNTSISNAFNSLHFGVMPLLIWALFIFEKLTFGLLNPLVMGRSFLVLSDLLSALIIFKISTKLFDKKAAILAVAIYLSLPLNFFHSRVILLESLTNLFSLVAIYFSQIFFLKEDHNHKKNYLYLFLAILFFDLSFFTKPLALVYYPAIFGIPVLAFFVFSRSKRKTYFLITTTLLSILITFLIIGLLYLPIAPLFKGYASTDLTHPAQLLLNAKADLWRAFWWSRAYLTDTILALSLIATAWGIICKNKKMLWLIFWGGAIVFMETVLSGHFYPRHLYPLVGVISIMLGWLFSQIGSKHYYLGLFFLLVVLWPSFLFINQVIRDPSKANIALEDKQQFFEDWTAGVGLKEVSQKLNQESQTQKIVIFVDDQVNEKYTFNKIYPIKNAEIIVSNNLACGQFVEEKSLTQYAANKKFVILNRYPDPEASWPIEQFYRFPKSNSRTINIYTVN